MQHNKAKSVIFAESVTAVQKKNGETAYKVLLRLTVKN